MLRMTPMDAPRPTFSFAESYLPPGLSVIEASAGTGKTYAISHLVPRLLLEGTVSSLRQILLVTFTNDATRELSGRVRQVLARLSQPAPPDEDRSHPGLAQLRARFPEEQHRLRLRRALTEIDQLSVSTIHSFCQRVLQAEGALCGLPTMPEVITDATEILDQAVSDFWQEHLTQSPDLAGLALLQQWSTDEDRSAALEWMRLENPAFEPSPAEIPQALQSLRHLAASVTPEQVCAFHQIARSVPAWNKAGPKKRDRFASLVSKAESILDLPLAERVALARHAWDLTECISARSAEGKRLRREAQSLPLCSIRDSLDQALESLRWSWTCTCATTVRNRIRTHLRHHRLITQDGLIECLCQALRRQPSGDILGQRLRERWMVALIDESQDTDPRQFEIFRRIFTPEGSPHQEDHRLLLIGDPKQAIFGFRGADLNTYLEARRNARAVFTLTTTYRSPQPLVEAINTLFQRPQSFLNPEMEFSRASSGLLEDSRLRDHGTVCPRLSFWLVPSQDAALYGSRARRTQEISRRTASHIVHLLQHGTIEQVPADGSPPLQNPVRPEDIAVLVSLNAEAEAMAEALRQRSVPAIITTGADVLASNEASEIRTLLLALSEPRRTGWRLNALATRLLGFGSSDIRRLREGSPEEDERWLLSFIRWQAHWRTHGTASILALIDAECGITERLAGFSGGERRATNFRHLCDLLLQAAEEFGDRPDRVLSWLGQEIARAQSRTDVDERQLQLESDRHAVQIVTMHKAKGLEYKLVFCPYLWTSFAPREVALLRRAGPDGADTLVRTALASSSGKVKRAEIEERLRLAYVALTRAQVAAWVFAGAIGTNREGKSTASALDWLLRADSQGHAQGTPSFSQWLEAFAPSERATQHREVLQSWVGSATKGDAPLGWGPPPPASDTHWAGAEPPIPSQWATPEQPGVPSPWALTSFTGLTREKHPHGSDPIPDIPDLPTSPFHPEAANPFLEMPGGTAVGSAVHSLLEAWDFRPVDLDWVERNLPRRVPLPSGLHLPSFRSSLTGLLTHLRQALTPDLGVPLAELCPEPRGSEWHFCLPVRRRLHPSTLAAIYRQEAGPEHRSYASRLDALPAEALTGFLHGFIDRIALHPSGWGVIDWKTNWLGPSPSNYRHESLLSCAMDQHYLLQAHLYLVALRRYLRKQRIAHQPAGAWIVFLRAVLADTSHGVLAVNPAPRLLDALDEQF